MDVLDEEGRLFGRVNVVDAMVVLVVLAVLVAGVALVVGGGDDTDPNSELEPDLEGPTRYATLTYDVPLNSDAAELDTGGQLAATGSDDAYDVMDVHRSFSPDGDVFVTTRVVYHGEFTAGGNRLYGGDSVEFVTDSYRINADVRAVNQSSTQLSTTTTPVVLETNVSRAVRDAIEPGTEATVAGDRVATITGVEAREDGDGQVPTLVGAELVTRDVKPVPAYDGTSLRIGATVTVVTDDVVISGDIVRVGSDDVDGATGG